MLPKHWGEPVGGGEVGEQLAAKQLSHNSLLLILSQAGVLPQLPAPVLRWSSAAIPSLPHTAMSQCTLPASERCPSSTAAVGYSRPNFCL